MARIALFGGSFNPPHEGHLDVMMWLQREKDRLGIDEGWILPTVNHAFGKELLPFEVRQDLLQGILGTEFKSRPIFKVVRRDERYTAEMLENLQREFPGDVFIPVMGADILHERHLWHRWDDIMKLSKPIFVARAGYEVPPGFEVHEVKAADPSSTEIRARLARGDKCLDVLPPVVSLRICRSGLYGFPMGGT